MDENKPYTAQALAERVVELERALRNCYAAALYALSELPEDAILYKKMAATAENSRKILNRGQEK